MDNTVNPEKCPNVFLASGCSLGVTEQAGIGYRVEQMLYDSSEAAFGCVRKSCTRHEMVLLGTIR